MNQYLRQVHRASIYNRTAVDASKLCGCFYCLKKFRPKSVKEWCDANGATARCPKCGIDSVLPASQVNLTDDLLRRMNDAFFGIKR